MRIASYNIRKAIGTDRRRDPDRVLKVIASLDADIVLLQEADRRYPPRPSALPPERIATLTKLRPLQIPGRDQGLGWHGNAILVGPDFTVLDIETIDLAGLEPRGALVAHLAFGQNQVQVAGTHLGLIRKSREKQQIALLRALANRSDLPTIIGGDLNERSSNEGLDHLGQSYSIHQMGDSYHAKRPLFPLDRIATSADITLHSSGMMQSKLAQLASDHLPIWADLSLG